MAPSKQARKAKQQPAQPPKQSSSSGSLGWYLRAVGIAIVAIAVSISANVLLQDLMPGWGWGGFGSSSINWDSRRDDVRNAFLSSWNAYSKYAWGQDQFHPVSKTGSQMSPHGLGWIIVDSIDTLMIMNLTSQLSDARNWIAKDLTYSQDQDVNTFEMTIRILGGLLSAHYLSAQLPNSSSPQDSVYLSKAVDLADRLMGAYDSQSGIPFATVNLQTTKGVPSYVEGGASSTAEAGTLQLEMKYLSELTGNEAYWRKSEKVIQVLDDNGMEDGLLPIYVNADTGKFTTSEIRLGSRGDSYYEYLIKQYLQTSGEEQIYKDLWSEALFGIQKHLVTTTKHAKLHFIAELPRGLGHSLSPKMDHLVCYLPGAIALGATGGLTEAEARKEEDWGRAQENQMALARELMKTCWGMYRVSKTGLAPEIVWFETLQDALRPFPGATRLPSSWNSKSKWQQDYIFKPFDQHNLQRPETVESLFMMWRITGDPMYREWGWEIFRAFQKHTKLEDGEGHSSLNSVKYIPAPRRDSMESFWLSETLKYLYLLFSPDDLLPLSDIVFNSEGHVFPRFKPKFKTGWERKRGVQYSGRN